MKRLLVILPAILLCLVAVALIAPSFVDWNGYKTQIVTLARSQSGLDVSIDGEIDAAIIPYPRVMARSIKVLSGTENLLTLEKIEIGVDLSALLTGQVAVSYVELLNPNITIKLKKDGKWSFMTPELESLSAKKTDAPSSSTMPQVSFEDIMLNGAKLSYIDEKSDTQMDIEEINGRLALHSINGPYEANFSLLVQSHPLTVDIKTQTFDIGSNTIPVNAKLMAQPGNISLSFDGAVQTGESFLAQGQIKLALESLEKTLFANNLATQGSGVNGALALEGFLNANASQAEIREIQADLGGQKIQGNTSIAYAPLSVKASLKSKGDIDLAKVLQGYPDLKTASFDIEIDANDKRASLSKGLISLNGAPISATGEFRNVSDTSRPELDIFITAKRFDTDVFFTEKNSDIKNNSVSYEDSLNQIISYVPNINLGFSAKIDELVYQKKAMQKVQVDLTLEPSQVTIREMSIGSYAGLSAQLTGKIGSLAALKDVLLQGQLTAKDLKAAAPLIGMKPEDLPAGLKQLDLKYKLEGGIDNLDGIVNVAAFGGEFIAKGLVKTPLEKPIVENLAFQIKHSNFASAVQSLMGSKAGFEGLTAPVDIYAGIKSTPEGAYALHDIRGDLSGMTFSGSATVHITQAKPEIKGEFKFGDFKMSAAPASAKPKSSQRWSKEPIELSGLNAINLDLNLQGNSLTYGPWILLKPNLVLVLQDGLLNVKDFSAKAFDGDVALTASVESAPQHRQPIQISATYSGKNVNVAPLIKALTGTQLVKAEGLISLEGNIKTSGLSQAALVYDLNGQGNLSGSNITLHGVDVERFITALSEETKPGDTALGLWKGVSKGGSTTFETLAGEHAITEGIIGISKLDLDGVGAAINTTGKIDLPNWHLETKHKITAKSKPDMPPFEVAFSGPLDNPAQTFGQGLLNDYLKRKVGRKVDDLISDKLGGKIGDLPLGGFLGGKTKAVPKTQPQNTQTAPKSSPEKIAPATGESMSAEPQVAPKIQNDPAPEAVAPPAAPVVETQPPAAVEPSIAPQDAPLPESSKEQESVPSAIQETAPATQEDAPSSDDISSPAPDQSPEQTIEGLIQGLTE